MAAQARIDLRIDFTIDFALSKMSVIALLNSCELLSSIIHQAKEACKKKNLQTIVLFVYCLENSPTLLLSQYNVKFVVIYLKQLSI
jgi:hypothetical protein